MATRSMAKARINLVPLSHKQKMLTTWWVKGISPFADKDVIIVDGAVRSGKTMIGSMSYVMWFMYNFDHSNFGLAGKSIDSLRRNLWVPIQQWFADVGIKVVRLRETGNGYVLRYSYVDNGIKVDKENYIYLFGGKDEGSAAFLQGLTAAGFFFDECALMPESFVNQGIARCSDEGAKIWFNCNPEGPYHWFKTKWVDRLNDRNALRLHFNMDDNPSLSEKTLTRYKNSWEGVFYQRFVLGEWVIAEGSIYLQFANNSSEYIVDDVQGWLRKTGKRFCAIYIGVDWGHNKSANTAVAIGITDRYEDVVIIDEWYTKEPLDPEQLYVKHMAFISNIVDEYGYAMVFADCAEMMMVRGLKNSVGTAKIKASVKPCIKYEIIDRIILENTLFAQHRIKIASRCKHVIDGFKSALWDEKLKKDVRLDDGTSNIDSLDATEYSLCSTMKQIDTAGYFTRMGDDGTNKWGVDVDSEN